MLATAAATTETLDWAEAAAAAVRSPDACAKAMAWVSTSATAVALVRSTTAEVDEACSRRRRAAEDDAAFRYFFAIAVRTARSAAAAVVLPEMRAMPWVIVVWSRILAAIARASAVLEPELSAPSLMGSRLNGRGKKGG